MLFKPQLNPNSLRIAYRKYRNDQDSTVASRLVEKKKEYDLKMMRLKKQSLNTELTSCTFHPKVLRSPQIPPVSMSVSSN